MASVQKVLIVGGGIGGLVAAVALRQKAPDLDVEIVEVNSKWDVYGVGIITLANSLRALAAVGLADKVLAAGYGMDKVDFFDGEGNFLHSVPQPRLAGPQYPSANALTRPRLHAILQEAVHAAGVPVRLGVTVAELRQTAEAVEVTFTDDTRDRYDLVIGADGIRSLVRQLVFGPQYQPRFTGQMIWRCNVPRPPAVTNFQMFHGMSGNKAGFVPLAPDLMYIFLTEKPKPGAETKIPEAHLAEAFRDPSQIVYRPFEEILLPPPWYRGRVVLIGDAAHAMSAHVAQGAAMAIEDAVVLAEEVTTKPTLQEALNGYMARRYERCKAQVEIARELARGEMENDRTVDVPGLTRKSMEIAAAPI
jgi:2-polyprenyl-6-methoxyphenol hydroxylase-like FAD-dependent oxidoreductase